jgi:processive 1,2-diacylglycerol beta-glucosyltransferase
MKIHIMFEHGLDFIPYGCSYIRLLKPFDHPVNSDDINITSGIDFDDGSSDVYIVERLWKPNITFAIAEELVNKIKKANKQLIYTLDDNLLDLNILNNGGNWPSLEQKNIIRFFAREADGIIVSTKPLKERFLHLNKNIIVVENSLDERLLNNRGVFTDNVKNRSMPKVIGYMGTPSHESDFMMILPSLREVLRKYKDTLKLQIIGIFSDRSLLNLFEGLSVEVLDVKGNVEYPRFMKWMSEHVNWDLAIAPLEDTKFTRCKSDIKYLDYSLLGICGIYSKVPGYENTIDHMVNGYLVENSNEKWVEAIDYLIKNDEIRADISQKAYEYVYSKRILKHCAHKWVQAVNQIISI